jgi:Lipid A 3-O-deacylase (PagL)
MKKTLSYLILLFSILLNAQENSSLPPSEFVITPEFLLGISAEANDFFPERSLQKQFIIGLGRKNDHNPNEWAYWLKQPKTGLNIGFTDLGNPESLGYSLSLMPYIEFDAFGRRQKDIKILVGMGTAYFNKKYDAVDNFYNQAITTDITWSFRASLNYVFLKTQKIDYRLGVVYFHNSNGHTKLPNQGLNSFLGSVSVDIKNPLKRPDYNLDDAIAVPVKSVYNYMSFRAGLGVNVFALAFNDKKGAYTFAGEYGKVWNKTYKFGLGFYYRFYDHYYDYINGNESLVQEGKEFESYKDNPWWNASNIGIHAKFEFLLNHFGIEMQIGANLFKPAYKIDWRINEGWDYPPKEIPDNWQLGEYTTKYQLKQIISTRMGIKYYLLGTNQVPKHNLFVAAHINANLGQADFSEISVGYVYNFDLKRKD